MKEDEGSSHSISSLSQSLNRESQAVEEDFIETYKSLPVLWDATHKHYTNKYKRNEALEVLLKILKRWNSSATRVSVRQKINILRSCYRKVRSKYLASKCIGPNGEEIYQYEPTSWKFHALRFLEKNCDSNDATVISEINVDDNHFEDEDDDHETESDNGQSISNNSDVLAAITEEEPPRKRSKVKKNPKFVKVEVDNDYYESSNHLLDRELEAIGANVTCKLKRMNSLQRYHAELLINKVLISGLKNNLSDDTDLTDVYRT